jgi:hypothetical protein
MRPARREVSLLDEACNLIAPWCVVSGVTLAPVASKDTMNEPTDNQAKRTGLKRVVPHLSRRAWVIVLSVFLGLIAAGVAGVSYASYRYAQDYEGRILPGSVIAGVDVGGMSTDEAIEAVRDAIGPQLDRSITISYGSKTWTVTPRELGAKSDARSAVRAALNESNDASFVKLMRMRVLGDDLGFEREVAITYPRQGIRGFVNGLAEGFDRAAREQSIDYSSGWVEFLDAREGRSVKQKATRQDLMDALVDEDDSIELQVATVEPKETDRYDQVLLVRIGENKLYLYQDGKITHDWVVAPGLPEYPTPTGEFEVELKRYLPTWVNPAPDTWGANMPESIPPGPGNPLGLRAINWTAPAIRFHGTSATYSLGYNASHGCVRMSNEDVIELYDLIDVGTPIISIEVGPLKPLYGSSSVVDTETTQENQDAGSEGSDDSEE